MPTTNLDLTSLNNAIKGFVADPDNTEARAELVGNAAALLQNLIVDKNKTSSKKAKSAENDTNLSTKELSEKAFQELEDTVTLQDTEVLSPDFSSLIKKSLFRKYKINQNLEEAVLSLYSEIQQKLNTNRDSKLALPLKAIELLSIGLTDLGQEQVERNRRAHIILGTVLLMVALALALTGVGALVPAFSATLGFMAPLLTLTTPILLATGAGILASASLLLSGITFRTVQQRTTLLEILSRPFRFTIRFLKRVPSTSSDTFSLRSSITVFSDDDLRAANRSPADVGVLEQSVEAHRVSPEAFTDSDSDASASLSLVNPRQKLGHRSYMKSPKERKPWKKGKDLSRVLIIEWSIYVSRL